MIGVNSQPFGHASYLDRGGVSGVGVVATEITDLKLAEERATRAYHRLRASVESIEDGFVLFDADDRLILCNERHRELSWTFCSLNLYENYTRTRWWL